MMIMMLLKISDTFPLDIESIDTDGDGIICDSDDDNDGVR